MRRLTLVLLLLLGWPTVALASFCTDRIAQYGDYASTGEGIVKCYDFSQESDTFLRPEWPYNPNNPSYPSYDPVFQTNTWWDPATTATADGTGALRWIIKSIDQVRSEFPAYTWLEAQRASKKTNEYFWWRWLGVNFNTDPQLPPGSSLYIQFKLKFNSAYKNGYGGNGAKMWGFDTGPRQVNGQWIPAGFNPATGGGTTALPISGTAGPLEITMTMGGYSGDPTTAYSTVYTGSTQYTGSQGFYGGGVVDEAGGSASSWQPGMDSMGVWNDTTKRYEGAATGNPPCTNHYASGTLLQRQGCVRLGNADEWHEVTIQMKPSSTYICRWTPTPCESLDGAVYTYQHDGILRVWYDGQNLLDLRPDARRFRSDQISAAACAATQSFLPSWNTCHTGVDYWRDERGVAPTLTGTWTAGSAVITNVLPDLTGVRSNQTVRSGTGILGKAISSYDKGARTITLTTTATASSPVGGGTFKLQGNDAPFCVAPCAADDPGADPTGFILWTLSYPRGYTNQDQCNTYTPTGSKAGVAVTLGSPIITMTSTAGLTAGMAVSVSSSTRFNPGTGSNVYTVLISSVNSGTQITVATPVYTPTLSGQTLYYGTGGVSSDLYQCNALHGDDNRWTDMQSHPEARIWYDDWIVSTVPLPMKRRAGGSAPARNTPTSPITYGLDARDLDMLPPMTWTRLWPGPDRSVHNTRPGTIPPGVDVYVPAGGPAGSDSGVTYLTPTNYLQEYVQSVGVPIARGDFGGAAGGATGVPTAITGLTTDKIQYMGGGHAGYVSNRSDVYDAWTGRWTEETVTPDLSCVLCGAALGPKTATPPGTGCPAEPITVKATTTGDVHAGSYTVDNIQNTYYFCPIGEECYPESGHTSNGYIIQGAGIPYGAAIQTRNVTTASAGQGNGVITMTHAATADGTQVTLTTGTSKCTTGGNPNGSSGNRPWHEHTQTRQTYDPVVGKFLWLQNSGTWAYDPLTQAWTLLVGAFNPSDPNQGMPCSNNDDYVQLGLRFNPDLDSGRWGGDPGGSMMMVCSAYSVYKLTYGSGPPSFTGAAWRKLYTFAPGTFVAGQNRQTQTIYDKAAGRLLYYKKRTTSSGLMNPSIHWFDPLAGTACTGTTPPFPCGQGGVVDMTGGPQGTQLATSSSEPTTCWTQVCQKAFHIAAYDEALGETFFVGRRDADAAIMLWGLTDPGMVTQQWRTISTFNHNVYANSGLLQLYEGAETADRQDGNSAGTPGLHYLPDRDAYILIMATGNSELGGTSRGYGIGNAGCGLNGAADDCVRMYGFRFGAGTPPAPPAPPGYRRQILFFTEADDEDVGFASRARESIPWP